MSQHQLGRHVTTAGPGTWSPPNPKRGKKGGTTWLVRIPNGKEFLDTALNNLEKLWAVVYKNNPSSQQTHAFSLFQHQAPMSRVVDVGYPSHPKQSRRSAMLLDSTYLIWDIHGYTIKPWFHGWFLYVCTNPFTYVCHRNGGFSCSKRMVLVKN